MKRLFLCAALCLVSGTASAKTYRIQPDYSLLEFHIRHLVTIVEGYFEKFEGTLQYDPEHPETSRVEVTIYPGTIDTRHKQRDRRLRGKEFFDVGKYPTARYVSESVRPVAKDRLQINGTLTLHGVSRPVALDVTMRGTTSDMFGRSRLGFAAEGTINRKDFGINWNEQLDNGGWLLGDDVKIEMEIDAAEK